jgi:glycogenin glucosyltransferase
MDWLVRLFSTLAICVSIYISVLIRLPIEDVKAPVQPIVSDEPSKKVGFVTLATPAFAMGAVTLGHTLYKHHGDKYDRICLVTPDVNTTWVKILSQFWKVVQVPEYRPMVHFRRSWTKFRMWNLTDYSKLVYLDTDVLVVKPIDELFSYSELSCVSDPNPPQICNTGVLVIEPGAGKFEKMDQMARVEAVRVGIGDQSSINAYFRGFTPLPAIYNAARTIERGLGELLERDAVKIIHFICKKPWKCGRGAICGCGYPHLNEVWWRTWDEACQGKMCLDSWYEPKATKRIKK